MNSQSTSYLACLNKFVQNHCTQKQNFKKKRFHTVHGNLLQKENTTKSLFALNDHIFELLLISRYIIYTVREKLRSTKSMPFKSHYVFSDPRFKVQALEYIICKITGT